MFKYGPGFTDALEKLKKNIIGATEILARERGNEK